MEYPTLKLIFSAWNRPVNSLREIADFFDDEEMIERTEELIESGLEEVQDEIDMIIRKD